MDEKWTIAVLPGDGIGKEVMQQAERVLDFLCESAGVEVEKRRFRVGGEAIDEYGVPLREEDLEEIKSCDAVLLGAVGGPKWEDVPYDIRPEAALLALRKELSLYANIRPVKVYNALIDASPLKPEIVRNVDLVVIRELTGGLYYGKPRGMNEREAYNTLRYTREEIERIARVAFEIARGRKKKVTSVDKANVLETFKFWRSVVEEVRKDYPDVDLEHLYVDNASMQLILRPADFDVLLCPNMFGDILSDEAATIGGSIGLLPSASVGEGGKGLYEPVHGSAPDIAGKGIANPLAMILSLAYMLRYSFKKNDLADLVESSVEVLLERGFRTRDLARVETEGIKILGTVEITDELIKIMKEKVRGEYT